MIWISFPLKDFGPIIFMFLGPELSTLPFLLDHSHQHTQIFLHFLTLRLPMLASYFPYSLSPLLHLLILLQRVFCSFPFTLAAVSKVPKACFPVVYRRGYLLSFSYLIPRHQSKLWSRLSISFFWGCLFSFCARGSTLSWCLLLLRLLVNNFISSSFSVTPLKFRVS